MAECSPHQVEIFSQYIVVVEERWATKLENLDDVDAEVRSYEATSLRGVPVRRESSAAIELGVLATLVAVASEERRFDSNLVTVLARHRVDDEGCIMSFRSITKLFDEHAVLADRQSDSAPRCYDAVHLSKFIAVV